MVVKELTASAYHFVVFLQKTNYVNSILAAYNSFRPIYSSLNGSYAGVVQRLRDLQNKTFQYEQESFFPFDGDPLLDMLSVNEYIGVGALESLIQLVETNPAEADALMQVAQNKLNVAQEIAAQLNSGLSRLPEHSLAANMYTPRPEKVMVRFVLPDGEALTLDQSAKAHKDLLNALKHIGKLDREPDAYSFEVVVSSHSSPESLLLAISVNGALALNFILKSVLKRWHEIETIRNVRAQTENIEADTELKRVQKEQALAALSALEDASGQGQGVANETVDKFGGELDGEGAEVVRAVEETVKYVENLVVNGGTVNIYLKAVDIDGDPGAAKREIIESRKAQVKLAAGRKLIQG
jgi:hypothetical protein